MHCKIDVMPVKRFQLSEQSKNNNIANFGLRPLLLEQTWEREMFYSKLKVPNSRDLLLHFGSFLILKESSVVSVFRRFQPISAGVHDR